MASVTGAQQKKGTPGVSWRVAETWRIEGSEKDCDKYCVGCRQMSRSDNASRVSQQVLDVTVTALPLRFVVYEMKKNLGREPDVVSCCTAKTTPRVVVEPTMASVREKSSRKPSVKFLVYMSNFEEAMLISPDHLANIAGLPCW